MLQYLVVCGLAVAGNASGRWVSSAIHAAHTCTIDRIPIDALTKAEFIQYYEEQYPVIIQGTTQPRLVSLTEKVRTMSHPFATPNALAAAVSLFASLKRIRVSHLRPTLCAGGSRRTRVHGYGAIAVPDASCVYLLIQQDACRDHCSSSTATRL